MTHATSRHTGNADDLKESAVGVKDAVADLATETSKYAHDRIADAKDSAAAMVETAKEKADEYNTAVMTFVRKNPYKAIAIAAGTGLVLGFLLRRH